MKLKCICLLFFLMLFSQSFWAQKAVTVFFPHSEGDKKVSVTYSIQEIRNYGYAPYKKLYKTAENKIRIEIPDSVPSIQLSFEPIKQTIWSYFLPLYIEKGENLNIYLDSINPPRFEGSNPYIYSPIFALKRGIGWERINSTKDEFNKATDSFFDFIDKKIENNVDSLDSLVKNRMIDEKSYAFAKKVLIEEILFRVSGIGLLEINKENYDLRVDSVTFYTDLSKVYDKYDNYYGNLYLGTKAMLKKGGLITGNRLDLDLWAEDSPYNFLNKEEQEIQYVSDVISDIESGRIDSIQLVERQNKFRTVYPTSIYNSVLSTLKSTESKEYIFAHYSENAGFNELGILKVDDLTKLTGMFLGGKPVFLDFWATWCGPCINEFNSRYELDPFLKENNIGIMYVSLDYGGNYEKWKETIKEKKLEGFHYLATPELEQQLPYFKESNTIPRFILIDKDGNILIDKCEFPSSGKLIPQIRAKLNL